ncbi:semaphorin-5B-like [Ruditapes philippinarum]|uniref:semaphorin-5B-like n=1 Tax=Ruditapes philippinarum TaxID=129788 RepID=UPI00295AB9F8|nr:semaphorin-5B-like [Ruditapes philippinarum]
MFLHKPLIILVLLVKETVAFDCYTCENVVDPDDCHNITGRKSDQSCYAKVDIKERTRTFTLGITNNENCGPIPIYNVTKVKRDVEEQCFECCSRDKCNSQLCQHRKPSTCIDDVTVDCAHMNVAFNICRKVHQLKKMCPKFCRLCSLVDGNWADWSEWSACDVTCDVGIHIRKRTCTNPAPAYQGLMCVGNDTETKRCNNMLCPVNGGWSDWSDWGECSVRCDTGLKKRNRSCSNPYPKRTGVHCFGDSTDVEICKQKPCKAIKPLVAFKSDTIIDFSVKDNKVFVFTNSPINTGGGYNNKTGIFVAPAPGLYLFTTQICLPSPTHIYIAIIVQGQVVAQGGFGEREWGKCYTLNALAKVGLADQVSVNCIGSCDSSDSLWKHNLVTSSFSGVLYMTIINRKHNQFIY